MPFNRPNFGANSGAMVRSPQASNFVGLQSRDLSNIRKSSGFNPMRGVNINPTPTNELAAISEDRAAIGRALNRIESRLETLESGRVSPMGGPTSSGSRGRNIAAFAAPPQVGKGGVLSLTFPTFAAGAVAGTTAVATISEAVRARLTETIWEYAAVVAEGDLADKDELRKISLRAEINGRPIPNLDRIPADLISDTLDGPQLMPVNEYVGADSDITVTFTVDRDLTTAAAAAISLRLWAGDGATFNP